MASSSDAVWMLGKADVIAQDVAKYRGKLTRMEGRLEDSNSVILEQLPCQCHFFYLPRLVDRHRYDPATSDKDRHRNIPSTCAKALSFRHYRDRGTRVWHAC